LRGGQKNSNIRSLNEARPCGVKEWENSTPHSQERGHGPFFSNKEGSRGSAWKRNVRGYKSNGKQALQYRVAWEAMKALRETKGGGREYFAEIGKISTVHSLDRKPGRRERRGNTLRISIPGGPKASCLGRKEHPELETISHGVKKAS